VKAIDAQFARLQDRIMIPSICISAALLCLPEAQQTLGTGTSVLAANDPLVAKIQTLLQEEIERNQAEIVGIQVMRNLLIADIRLAQRPPTQQEQNLLDQMAAEIVGLNMNTGLMHSKQKQLTDLKADIQAVSPLVNPKK
jgi:hypothetical protein